MSYHPDSKIPSELLAPVEAWIARAVNDYSVTGTLPETEAGDFLRCCLGKNITFARLARLTGLMVSREAADRRLKIPPLAEDVFTGFAQRWSPAVPRCAACEFPALRPREDQSGVDALPEGAVCPWCGEGAVRVVPFRGTLTSWVTGQEVPLDTPYDDVTVRGIRLQLQEDDLRALARADLLALLDQQGVPVHAWLRHLVVADEVFGLRGHLTVLASLRSDAVMQHGDMVVAAQVLAARRRMERPPLVVVDISVREESGAPVEDLVYGALCRLSPPQFEAFLFRARVPVHMISGGSAAQSTRAREVMGLVRVGTLKLDSIREVARAVAAAADR